jgi:hypothetical protein
MRRGRRRRTVRGRQGARGIALSPAGWIVLALATAAALNFVYQVARKPTELLGLVMRPSPKSPPETWERYGALFREHATDLVAPETLAALVQAESAGDPLARTYWRWRWSTNPFDVYAPASSAVGLLQITDATFDEARRFCIHDHAVARDGAWHDPRACWFNALYFRTVPSHAVEMTSARLHHVMEETLAREALARPVPRDAARLAAVVHLCGRERGFAFARRGYRAAAGERCGDHDLAAYLARVDGLAAGFARLARER